MQGSHLHRHLQSMYIKYILVLHTYYAIHRATTSLTTHTHLKKTLSFFFKTKINILVCTRTVSYGNTCRDIVIWFEFRYLERMSFKTTLLYRRTFMKKTEKTNCTSPAVVTRNELFYILVSVTVAFRQTSLSGLEPNLARLMHHLAPPTQFLQLQRH